MNQTFSAMTVSNAHDGGAFPTGTVISMNRATLEQSLQTGFCTYWSRSRGKVWMKGEESGHTQRIVEAFIDCDGDTWTARPHADGEALLSEPTSMALWQAIKEDNARRKAARLQAETGQDGYWIERCSGPPYFVAKNPETRGRFRNSG